ncbi:MAG TPA: M3 family oligoendopeptidase [Clostridia bacterium]|nr:M3 family oligoendopeptidase [Clostridia bacterium]
MQKFSEFEYRRPDLAAARRTITKLTRSVKQAKDFAEAEQAIFGFSALQSAITTQMSLAHVRHTIDISDAFYEKEQQFYDRAMPLAMPWLLGWYRAVLKSRFKKEIDARFGTQYLHNAQRELSSMSPKLMLDMIRENKLTNEYEKLLASCKVDFHGEKLNLAGLRKYAQNPDRALRREAAELTSAFLKSHEQELDALYDKLVKLRTRMGRKLGYKDYTPLGYLRMGRTFTPEEAASFREQVAKVLVPLCSKLYEEQAARIGVDKLRVYDEAYQFADGNAKPEGERDFMVASAKRMYRELSPETGEFFDDMVARELMDLDTKPNKRVGGYCTAFPEYKATFIFSNFNGTTGDVDVLTHEAGHAFAATQASAAQELLEYMTPGMEVAEIHSMSMEYFTYPWMGLFFGDMAEKYRYAHILGALVFVPYGVMVDEFQHTVYAHPDLTPAERKAEWAKLEKKYLPQRDYDGDEFMRAGSFWQKQHHIYSLPFYYIDYTLASMGAFEFFGRMTENREKAWKDYLALCRAGGSLPYKELLALAGLSNPFEQGSVEKAAAPLMKALGAIDPKAL